MGKRRKTAKTGDKALYRSRPNESGGGAAQSDDDGMYNAVDRFLNRREEQDFLKLDAGGSDSEEDYDDGISGREGVLDLGGGDSSSDEEEEDDSIDQRADKKHRRDAASSEKEPISSDSDDESDILNMEDSDVRDWGRNKSSYYSGDTADLEIGQDEDDAFLEEEAAKEIVAARYEQMDEDDFVMSDDEDEKKVGNEERLEKTIDMRGTKDLSNLSRFDRLRLLQSHHPELTPLVSHFKHPVEEWDCRTSVVAKAIFEGDEGTIEAIGATRSGIQYLLTKAFLQSSTALNVAMYLLLKSEQAVAEEDTAADLLDVWGDSISAIQSHPVIARLQQLNKLAQKLEDRVENKVETLSEQVDNLVKASDMVNGDENDETSEAESYESDEKASLVGTPVTENPDSPAATVSTSSEEESEDDIAAEVMNEARFGLRPQELAMEEDKDDRRPRLATPVATPVDFGDEELNGLTRKAALSLASTINTIEQRSATQSRKKRPAHTTEALDEQADENEAFQRGLAMMEAELGRESDNELEKSVELDDELDDDIIENNFYKSVKNNSEAKKQRKAAQYMVAPKYPGIDAEIEGERAISKTIMKNRGLVAHKSKLNRNPRVKKREQYRKALVRRKGHVREVRTEEGHKYGGEETGIKSGLSRSRKLGT